MASLHISEVLPSNDVYRKFILDTLQEYALSKLEDVFLWGTMRSDFKNWTGKVWERINGLTWSKIRKFCIPCDIWIDVTEHNAAWSEILLKLFSTKYDDDLMDWDMKQIKQVEKVYVQVSRGIQLRKQELLVQQTQDPCFNQQPPLVHSHIQQTQSLPQQQLFISQDSYNQQDFRNQQGYHNPRSDPRSTQYHQTQLYEQQ